MAQQVRRQGATRAGAEYHDVLHARTSCRSPNESAATSRPARPLPMVRPWPLKPSMRAARCGTSRTVDRAPRPGRYAVPGRRWADNRPRRHHRPRNGQAVNPAPVESTATRPPPAALRVAGAWHHTRLIGLALFCFLSAGDACADPAVDARISALVASRAAPGITQVARRPHLDRAGLSAREPGPVWFTADGPRPAVGVALRELRAAAERGLAPEDYDVDALEREVEAAQGQRSRSGCAGARRRRDERDRAAIPRPTFASAACARSSVEPHYRVPAKDAAFVAELRDAVAGDRLAATDRRGRAAHSRSTSRLKRLLANYRPLAAQPAIRAAAARVAARQDRRRGHLRRRAGVARATRRGWAIWRRARRARPTTGTRTTLAEAVQRFQARHGLQPDGVLGKDTLAALNVPLAARVGQIALSLERLRWLPELPAGPLIAINIPSFRLWAFADAPVARARDAVDARRRRQGDAQRDAGLHRRDALRRVQPVLERAAEHPAQRAPAAARERSGLSRARGHGDREHAAATGLRSRRTPARGIAALRSGEARLRQRPGPRNALGGVKFVLPNTMDIYLHATPARELFERTRRDFSHGCIRVREPEALAQFVLRDQPEWTPAQIEAAMTSGVNRTVPLARADPGRRLLHDGDRRRRRARALPAATSTATTASCSTRCARPAARCA